MREYFMRLAGLFVVLAFLIVLGTQAAFASFLEREDKTGNKASQASVDEKGCRVYVLVSDKMPDSTASKDYNPLEAIQSAASAGLGGMKPLVITKISEADPEQAMYLFQLSVERVVKGNSVRDNWSIPFVAVVLNYKLSQSAEGKWKKIDAGRFRIVSRSNLMPGLMAALYGGKLLTVKVTSFKPVSGATGRTLVTGKVTNNTDLIATSLSLNCPGGATSAYLPFTQFPIVSIKSLAPGESTSFSVEVDARYEPDDTEVGTQVRDWSKAFVMSTVWVKPEDKVTAATGKEAGKEAVKDADKEAKDEGKAGKEKAAEEDGQKNEKGVKK